MRAFPLLLILTFITALIWRNSFFSFFAQDDFFLLNHFSQNTFQTDLARVFGADLISHWRPIQNFFFFSGGELFGKKFFYYHLVNFLIHLGVGFLLFKILLKITREPLASFVASLMYLSHSAHFVSLFWISGSATTIGSFFLLISFYSLLEKKRLFALTFYLFSILASEAMIVGFVIFTLYSFIFKKLKSNFEFLLQILILTILFVLFKITIFTPKSYNEIYKLIINQEVIFSIKYYLLRIFGIAEISGDKITTIFSIILAMAIFYLAFRNIIWKKNLNYFLLFTALIVFGLFPFILLPNHLSPHYMNIPIVGFVGIIALATRHSSIFIKVGIVVSFLVINILNIEMIEQKNWITPRADVAQKYIFKIDEYDPDPNTYILFGDSGISDSYEAYISLGTGSAIDFWFKDKNYRYCFEYTQECSVEQFENSLYIN